MWYAINSDKSTEVICTCNHEPTVTEIDWIKNFGAKFYTLEEAISIGAIAKDEKGNRYYVGVDLKVRINEGMAQFWWLGKWRSFREWNRKTKPSDKWVQEHVERTIRINGPLPKQTVVVWHWAA